MVLKAFIVIVFLVALMNTLALLVTLVMVGMHPDFKGNFNQQGEFTYLWLLTQFMPNLVLYLYNTNV